jgi:cellulose synthase/poly-beta-1,6-N-acetylglucosamine synthase-like glycosyltransferase
VTLVVPVRNEEGTIDACLESLVNQAFPRDALEIIVVDGESTDDTVRHVDQWKTRDHRIRLLSNPARVMAEGLNLGIAAAGGSIIGVISGHSTVSPDYVERTVRALRDTRSWSVGGRIERAAASGLQRAIAIATSSPVGIGNAQHNYAEQPQWVDAVFPGTWPREVFDRVGLFDPAMTANEDNEFSYRIRRAGGRIWYDPSIVIRYVPRASVPGLFRQYRRYALGRALVFAKHRGGLQARHLIPPAWLAWVFLGAIGSLFSGTIRAVWLVSVGGYLLVIVAAGFVLSRRGGSPPLITVALGTLHLAYGIGMWQGLAGLLVRPRAALLSGR